MGELKIQYSDKKVTPFGGMKLLKDFMDTTNIIDDLRSVNLPYPQSNAGCSSCSFSCIYFIDVF